MKVPVLDHGFVILRNIAGPTRRHVFSTEDEGETVLVNAFDADDTDPPNAARMSFDQTDTSRTREQDIKLADYLMKNKHTSPFEQVQVWLEMKLPIFVARQFVRHRTVRLNEVSGRYVTLPAEWYIPEVVGGKAPNAKQGQVDTLESHVQLGFKVQLATHCQEGYEEYTHAIASGVAPEHARLFLSLNHYTHWLWNQDLHNLMHFLSLRDHPHAQVEAQAYARAIDGLIRQQLPESMALYDKYRRMP
jgi:thymidylate synthase (FAD)